MVSPPRKKKADRRTRTGPSTSTATPAGSQRLRFPSKPLTNKRFYLDIKNHAALKKLGDRVNSLGGKLELFLVKEVDYVVTDRDASTFTKRQPLDQVPTPSPLPSFCSVSPATTDSPTDGLGNRKTRSRAEAMLERVKQQPLKTTGDILNNALAWKIPIYPLSKFLNWLEKISSKTSQVCRDQNSSLISSQGRGLKVLTGTYLKIETGFRPEFKQFTSWPALGFLSSRATSSTANRAKPPTVTVLAQSSANCGNFERDDQTGPTANKDLMSNEPSQRMTRKVGRTGKEASSAIGGGNGYCEICRIHYDQLDSHTISAQHLKLVTDSAQYSQLDSIIQQNNLGSNSLRKSLRIAKSPPPFLPPEMGGKHSSGSTGGMVDSGSVGKDYTKTLRLKECSVSLGPPSPLLNGHTTVTLKTSRSGKLSSPALMPAAAMNGCSRRSQRSQPMQESSDREGVDALNLTPVGDHNLRSRKASSAQTPMTPPPPERLPSPPPEKLSSSHLRSGTLSEKAMTRSDRSRRSEDRGPSTRSSVERVPPQKIQPERATTVTSRRFRERSVDSEQAAKTPSKSSERPSRHHSRHKTRIKEEKSDDDDSKKPRKQDEDPVEDEERAERRRKRDERTDQDDKSRSSDKDKWCTSHDRIPKSDRSLRVRERTYYEDTESEESPAFPTKTVRSSKMKKRASSKSRVTKKRLSVEEKFIEDNKSYYKVEVLNSKLRSTEYFVNQRQAEERVNGESASDEVKPVVVRFKKIRTTEVALLSDEAESFMFGEPKKQGSEDEGVDRSQDEAFSELGRLKDETSERSSEKNSSVRTDSDMIAVKPPSTDSIAVSIKEEDPEEDEEPIEEDLSKMTFSFEKPPTKEPWLEALLRQREGTEFYIPMFHEYPKVVLPYQVKRQWRKPGRKPGTSTSLVAATPTSAVVTTPAAVATPSSPFHRKDRVSRLIQASVDDKPRKSPRNLNAVRRGVSTSGSVPALTSDNISLKPEDISNEPGERCHASTLAIMSSLMRRRPMRECAEKPVSYEEESSLPETVESSGSNSNSMDVKAQTPSEPPRVPPSNDFDAPFSDDKIAEALLNGVTHLDDYEPATCFQVDPDCLKDDVPVYSKPGLNMPVEEILATYPSCNSMNIEENLSILRTFPGFYRGQADSCASSDCSDFLGFMEDGQAATKKRKKRRNLTGWPIEKPKKKRDKDLGGSCLLLNSRPVTPEPARLTSAAATPRSACSNKKRGRPGKARPCLSAALPIPSDPAATSSPPPSSPFSEYSDLPIKKKIARFGTRRSIFK